MDEEALTTLSSPSGSCEREIENKGPRREDG